MLNKIKKLHYGWVIAGICFFMIFLSLGLCNSPHGLYQIPMTTSTGISRAQFSSISAFRFVTTSVFYLFFGFITKKIGVKKMALAGFFFLSISFFLLSLIDKDALYFLYIGAILWGIGGAFTGNTMVSVLVNSWFEKHNGLVLGLCLAASGIGGSLFSQLVQKWIDGYSWRIAYRIGASILVFDLLLVLFLLKEKPEQLGLVPVGHEDNIKKVVNSDGVTLNEALHSYRFYLVMIYALLGGMVTNPVYSCVPAQMSDKGFGASASLYASILFISIAVAKVFLGELKDRFGLKIVLVFVFVINISSIILLLLAKREMSFIIFAVTFGFSIPIENLIPPLVTRQLFGSKDYASIAGIIMAMICLGSSIGNKLTGICYDKFQSYRQSMIILLCASFIAFFVVQISLHNKNQ